MPFYRTARSGRRLTAFLCLLAAPLALAVLCTATLANAATPVPPAGASRINPAIAVDSKCKLTKDGPVCSFTKKNKKKKIDTDAEDGASGDGKRDCGPGYVALDKPNKCGAFCQLAEGDPCAKPSAPAVAKECGYGMIGTPPDHCDCPAGSKFKGAKGCVATYGCQVNVTDVNNKSIGAYGAGETEGEARSELTENVTRNSYIVTGPVTCRLGGY
jgi:hypothetical protein